MKAEGGFILSLVALALLYAMIWPAYVGERAGQLVAAFNAAAFPQQCPSSGGRTHDEQG